MVDYVRRKTRIRILNGEHVDWVENSRRAPYIRAVVLSAPPWVSMAQLRQLQLRARQLTLATGEQWVLDHIVPLNHPRVCGLTVPWNLRIIKGGPNSRKGNHFCPEQLDLEFLNYNPLGQSELPF